MTTVPPQASIGSSAACLLTRDPFRVKSGRTSVLRTAINALLARFDQVNCFVFEPPPASPDQVPAVNRASFTYLGSPSPFRSPISKCGQFACGKSLNETLFYDGGTVRRIKSEIPEQTKLVYCDSIRLAQYAASIEIPWILDMDDLLSARFRQFADGNKTNVTQILGHFASVIPKPLISALSPMIRPMLALESKRLLKQENFWANEATQVSLVSSDEATSLAIRTGRNVHSLPMSVPDVDMNRCWATKTWNSTEPLRVAFVGYLAYKPNIEAIEHLASTLIPALNEQGINCEVSVIGSLENVVVPQSAMCCEQIKFLGFVDSLNENFDSQHAFIAPILTGTGVKTKVLEAMRYGIPVLGTPLAFSGLPSSEATSLCWRTTNELAAIVQQLTSLPKVKDISHASMQLVQQSFSESVIRERWNHVIDELLTQ
ncbi:glycosyltransferase [Novipirellula sp. SH528]|uniref:glycosyltransferase n=1 Tax=Novipirellula sp. SH528 TaxID=3454466 RepID=UPI003FA12F70